MNLRSGHARLVLLCPAWKKWGSAKTVKPATVILHSRGDDVIPFEESLELVRASGLLESGDPSFISLACLGNPDPVVLKVHAPLGEATSTTSKQRQKTVRSSPSRSCLTQSPRGCQPGLASDHCVAWPRAPVGRRRPIRPTTPTTRATTLLPPAGSISGTLSVNATIDVARIECPAAVGWMPSQGSSTGRRPGMAPPALGRLPQPESALVGVGVAAATTVLGHGLQMGAGKSSLPPRDHRAAK